MVPCKVWLFELYSTEPIVTGGVVNRHTKVMARFLGMPDSNMDQGTLSLLKISSVPPSEQAVIQNNTE